MRTRVLVTGLVVGAAVAGCSATDPVATALSFRQQPSSVTVNQAIMPPVVVGFVDNKQTQVTDTDAMITLVLTGGPGGAILGGTVEVMSVNGVATFSNLTINQAGAGYQLTAIAEGFTEVTSDAFNVTP